MPNYRFSSTQMVNIDGEHLEPGVPVDYEVSLIQEDELEGVDIIIEFAIDRIVN